MKSAAFATPLFASLLLCVPMATPAQQSGDSNSTRPSQSDADRIKALEARVAQLERMVDTLVRSQSASAQSSVAAPPDDEPSFKPPSTAQDEALVQPAASPVPAESAAPPPSKPNRLLIAKAQSQELLPSLGKIGASVFLDAGTNSGPFTLNRGSYYGGGLSLPLALLPGGRVSYEVSVGLAQNSRNVSITSNVAQLINLTVLDTLYPNGGAANLQQAFTGTGAAPFAVTVPANWRAQTLQVAPLAARYEITRWDRNHLRPYAVGGIATYVTISNQVTTAGIRENANLPPNVLQLLQTLFSSGSPLSGALLGGQIATAPELKASGIPTGEGGLDVGMFFGGGLEWRIHSGFSLAVDDRYNYAPSGTSYNLTLSRLGWHF